MSDFLTRLAARASGNLQLIRPRLASWFEPQPDTAPVPALPSVAKLAGALAPLEERERGDLDERAPVLSSSARPSDPAELASDRRPARQHRFGAPEARTVARLTTPAAPEAAFDSAEWTTPAQRLTPRRDSERAAPLTPQAASMLHLPSATRESQPDSIDRRAASSPVAPARSARSAEPASTEDPTGRSTAPGGFTSDSSAAKGAAKLAGPADLSPVRTFQPSAERATPPARSTTARKKAGLVLPDRAAEATAEPVIQVTIGRIEVRAAPPSQRPSSRRRGSAEPIVTLDQYLRARAPAGGR